ncbi:MAG: hypothetical protein H6835_09440 [Planctomycetes bacterium]|nr:hypothetical protein [Planctomycetota bacterium]
MRSLVPVLALAAAFAALPPSAALRAQQFAFSVNDNPSYSNNAVGWPASVLAFRFTATVPVVSAAQVFTGNQPPALHTVEIRTRNTTTGLPDLLVGQPGQWSTTHTRSFQGAEFAQPANLIVGDDYFLVWRVTGMFHQHSVSDPNEPSNVPVEVRVSDGATWHAQTTLPAKFRLFAPYQTGFTFAYGAGKPGIYGEPSIGVHGWPSLASPLDVWLDDAARNAVAVLVLGAPIPTGVPLGFADLYVTPDLLLAFVTKTQTSPLTGGFAYTLWVPDQPSAIGLPISFQWGVFDAAAADGFSHTGAVTAVLN